MKLLNTESLDLHYFIPDHVPDYVILSHPWCAEVSKECTFENITTMPISNARSPVRKKQGFSKIEGACRQAARDGYLWIWIDSCCIDKSSSVELQEAINSMWNYYVGSNICYLHKADVADTEDNWGPNSRRSEWFTRGWTLQELLALHLCNSTQMTGCLSAQSLKSIRRSRRQRKLTTRSSFGLNEKICSVPRRSSPGRLIGKLLEQKTRHLVS